MFLKNQLFSANAFSFAVLAAVALAAVLLGALKSLAINVFYQQYFISKQYRHQNNHVNLF